MIEKFWKEFYFLSNFSPSDIWYGEKVYPTNEHFYQAHKATTVEEHEKIRCATTAREAAQLGRTCKIVKNWEKIKVTIMRRGLELKFSQSSDLQKKLLETGDRFIVEGNNHGDIFWGVCNGNGRNMLGHLLMELRSKLRLSEVNKE